MLYYLQEKLIFLPTKLDNQYQYSFEEPFEEFFITRPDGAILNALHFKRDNPRGVILYFHGNAGNLDRWGEEVLGLVRRNYDLVVMDYRTYGKSSGKLSETALLEDAQAFYDYVAEINDKKKIILFGRSLGTAMASYLSSRNQASMLILETPFYSLLD
ncbi:MAG: lysophospholipase, partial [Muriicola sp.]|nr:lysophospholipase [Muriicola sp.]NNK36308.1 alpha/beta fold hydrolase [Eudoraea sp.]